MFVLWSTAVALAGPMPVVAVGDGVVAGPPTEAAAAPTTVPGGWVPVLADCLEERAPSTYTVIDRAVAGETATSARKRADEIRELRPGWVVVTLGANELSDPEAKPEALQTELDGLLQDLRGKGRKAMKPSVLLVGLVPPTLSQGAEPPAEGVQEKTDARTATWNGALAAVAKRHDDITLVDLWSDWPREGPAREGLTSKGWHLSDQGHARVAAAICDQIR